MLSQPASTVNHRANGHDNADQRTVHVDLVDLIGCPCDDLEEKYRDKVVYLYRGYLDHERAARGAGVLRQLGAEVYNRPGFVGYPQSSTRGNGQDHAKPDEAARLRGNGHNKDAKPNGRDKANGHAKRASDHEKKRLLRDSLNNHLCGKLHDCDTSAKLLDEAQSWNRAQPKPLPSAVVEKCARKVWQDLEAGHLKPWRGRTSKAAQDDATMMSLCRLDPKHACDAWFFLTKLRYLHSARCERGKTFNINPDGMVAAQVIPGWGRHRYERARDLLLKAELIECARAFVRCRGGAPGTGAQYRFPSSKSDGGE